MQALANIKVLDLTQVLAGPFCAYQLALLGADVIKIERPHEPDFMRITPSPEFFSSQGLSSYFVTQNGNKRALTLDLMTTAGQDIFKQLVRDADVVVENSVTLSLHEAGLSYEHLKQINPRLVYCSISGFGKTGEKALHPAYDTVIQAASGYMEADREPGGGPRMTSVAVLDYGTGAMAAMAILAALLQRQHTGTGQKIDVSMMEVAFQYMGSLVTNAANGGTEPQAGGDIGSATMDTYDTADGQLVLSAATHGQMRRFWNAVGHPEEAERIASLPVEQIYGVANSQRLLLRELFARQSGDSWMQLLHAADVPAEKVRTLVDAIAQPQVSARNFFQQVPARTGDTRMLKLPTTGFTFAHDSPKLHSPAPGVGEHTEEILGALGLSAQDIAALREARVI